MNETVHVSIEVEEVPGGYRPVVHLTGLDGRKSTRRSPDLICATAAEARAEAHRATEAAKETTWAEYPDVEFVVEDAGLATDGQHR